MIDVAAKTVLAMRPCDVRGCRAGLTKTGRIRKGARVVVLYVNGTPVAALCVDHGQEARDKLDAGLCLLVPA